MVYLLFAAGLVLLVLGGDWLVRGAVGLAERFRVPPLVIGLTIVGFGTSAPELLVSLKAALSGRGGIAIGNVVGSNIANILLILGIAALIGPIVARMADLRRDLAWMLGSSALLVPLFWNGNLGRIEGAVLVVGILVYLAMCLRSAGDEPAVEPAVMPVWKALGLVVVGLAALVGGAQLLVDSATVIARTFGVSEAVIGLTIVAVGTSLPEFATTITAAIKGQRDIALGNVIGSNIFNVLSILGITALIAPIPVEGRFLAIDVPFMLAVSLALTMMIWRLHGFGRIVGGLMLLVYAGYVAGTAAI